MDDIYTELLKNSGQLRDAEEVEYSGMDDVISNKQYEELPNQIKVASLGDLSDFFRIATDTLIHKAQRDLWRISEDQEGQIVVERLFNPKDNKPIKV